MHSGDSGEGGGRVLLVEGTTWMEALRKMRHCRGQGLWVWCYGK